MPPTTPTAIPAWLRAATNIELDDEEEDSAAAWTSALPTCELDCTDGERYYLTLCAWSVDWAKVSLAHFMPAWLSLSKRRRKNLLRSRRMFADEIGEHWIANMLQRDDAAMLAVVLGDDAMMQRRKEMVRRWIDSFVADTDNGRGSRQKLTSSLGTACARLKAINCLDVYLHSRFFEEDFDRCQTLRFFEGIHPDGMNHGAVEMAEFAAEHGRLALLEIITRFDGIKWYSRGITDAAARGGHLECLQFLRGKYDWSRAMCLRNLDDFNRDWIRSIAQQDGFIAATLCGKGKLDYMTQPTNFPKLLTLL